jgi:ketosteroid isomerase-like protein
MSFRDKVKNIYDMMAQGQLLEAFEKYYHDDVVMIEIGEAPCVGKDLNREREKNFVGMIKEVHAMSTDAITSDEANGVTMVESSMDCTFQDGNRIQMQQVAVQYWQGDHIVKEVFYHK